MIIKGAKLSNDQVDRHGDKMTLGALKQARDQTNSKVIVSHNEHDFRMPPIGRMEKSYIQNIDGINWLLGDFRLFTLNDINHENKLKNRELAIYDQDINTIQVTCDRSYRINDLVTDVELLQNAFDQSTCVGFENKKSIEPLSTLTILVGMGATFAVSQFFNGFFSEAGKDAWNELKKIVKKNKEIKPHDEKQYQFIFTFRNDIYKTELMLIFTNPEPDGIECIIKNNQAEIDKRIIKYYSDSIRVKRIVYTCENHKLTHAYSVYKCGTPFDISNINKYKRLLESKAGK